MEVSGAREAMVDVEKKEERWRRTGGEESREEKAAVAGEANRVVERNRQAERGGEGG